MEKIEIFQENNSHSWYRGVGNVKYELRPSIARRKPVLSIEELRRVEKSISNTFMQRSPPFVSIDLKDEWKMLFYMQHYGIPTRLLDWTENPYVALYFALSNAGRDRKGVPNCDVAIWMCDPVSWNQAALSYISYKGGVLDDSFEEIKAYSPSSDVEQRATTPVMIYGTHNSPRIVAQRGVFALFGKGIHGMEEIYENSTYKEKILQKIVIRKEDVDAMLKSLYRKGIAESTIYPDLFGLSLEIKRNHGFY